MYVCRYVERERDADTGVCVYTSPDKPRQATVKSEVPHSLSDRTPCLTLLAKRKPSSNRKSISRKALSNHRTPNYLVHHKDRVYENMYMHTTH